MFCLKSKLIQRNEFKVQLTQVESHVKILDFLFGILKEHVKKPSV